MYDSLAESLTIKRSQEIFSRKWLVRSTLPHQLPPPAWDSIAMEMICCLQNTGLWQQILLQLLPHAAGATSQFCHQTIKVKHSPISTNSPLIDEFFEHLQSGGFSEETNKSSQWIALHYAWSLQSAPNIWSGQRWVCSIWQQRPTEWAPSEIKGSQSRLNCPCFPH